MSISLLKKNLPPACSTTVSLFPEEQLLFPTATGSSSFSSSSSSSSSSSLSEFCSSPLGTTQCLDPSDLKMEFLDSLDTCTVGSWGSHNLNLNLMEDQGSFNLWQELEQTTSPSSTGTPLASPLSSPANSLVDDPLGPHVASASDLMDFMEQADLPQLAEQMLQNNDAFTLLHDLELESLESQDRDSLSVNGGDEAIKADLMWSSTVSNHKRNRDVSLTLSECAEALFKDVDLLGSSPPLIGISPHNVLGVKTEASDSDHEDEEIDVVSDDSASTVSAYSTGSSFSPTSSTSTYSRSTIRPASGKVAPAPSRPFNVKAGRSLLRNRQQPQATMPAPRPSVTGHPIVIDHMNGDHCYFQVRPPVSPASNNGILTPNESSDDEDQILRMEHGTVLQRGQKRKLSPSRLPHQTGANNTSSNNRSRTNSMSENVKFKFRMKFQSNSPQRRSLLAMNNRHHLKRKSAVNNSHCPPSPIKEGQVQEGEGNVGIISPRSMSATPGLKTSSSLSKKARNNSGGSHNGSISNGSTSNGGGIGDTQKCREIRDLHNSMERQRRVDLRNNFDQLKEVVPELADVDKASKLNILNKASEFCRQLTAADSRLKRDRETIQSRNLALKRKLQQLMASYPSGSQGSSRSVGRISVFSRH
ncbi:N-myc protein-like [Tigriopus californicus]|uniref:N-myc protein-like n=1 Tax=Tigriopus californicus TaxID=6832 RepID=UPI0027DA97CB|nr:N-myc protein-like [Tigriopus californicus]